MSDKTNFPHSKRLKQELRLAIHAPDDVDSVPCVIEQGLARRAIMHIDYYLSRITELEAEKTTLITELRDWKYGWAGELELLPPRALDELTALLDKQK